MHIGQLFDANNYSHTIYIYIYMSIETRFAKTSTQQHKYTWYTQDLSKTVHPDGETMKFLIIDLIFFKTWKKEPLCVYVCVCSDQVFELWSKLSRSE